MSETLDEKLARIADEAYERRDEPIPDDAKVTRGHDRTKTLQVRLNQEEYDQLAAMASERELPVSTLVRSMLLGSLRPKSETAVEERVEKLERQVSTLIESVSRAQKRARARKTTASKKTKTNA